MSRSGRIATHIADTSYLLCFGLVSGGLDLLAKIFGGGLGAPPAVKIELANLPHRMDKHVNIRQAAQVFIGRRAGLVAQVDFWDCDEAERDHALACFKSNTLPSRHNGHFAEPTSPGKSLPSVKNSGEAEAIAVALRMVLPVLVTDTDAMKYAAARGVRIETVFDTLRHFGSLSTRQKFQLARQMSDRGGNIGATVKGQNDFRVLPPRS